MFSNCYSQQLWYTCVKLGARVRHKYWIGVGVFRNDKRKSGKCCRNRTAQGNVSDTSVLVCCVPSTFFTKRSICFLHFWVCWPLFEALPALKNARYFFCIESFVTHKCFEINLNENKVNLELYKHRKSLMSFFQNFFLKNKKFSLEFDSV